MDNREIRIISEGSEDFRIALSLFKAKTIIGYKIIESADPTIPDSMVLYEFPSKHATAFPFPFTSKLACDFVLAWLEQVDYGKQPDHDGDNHKGWKMENEEWGRVNGDSAAFVKISPEWAMYGK